MGNRVPPEGWVSASPYTSSPFSARALRSRRGSQFACFVRGCVSSGSRYTLYHRCESHGHAAARNAPLQGRLYLCEGNELGVGSAPLDPIEKRRATTCTLSPSKSATVDIGFFQKKYWSAPDTHIYAVTLPPSVFSSNEGLLHRIAMAENAGCLAGLLNP